MTPEERPVVVMVDGREVPLREAHDFSWLGAFGRVFLVLAGSVSGCLGFGVEQDGRRYYIRHAGALPFGFFGDPAQAAYELQASRALYQDVSHPALVPLLSQQAVPGGYIQVFPWFPGYPLTPPEENCQRFHALPLVARLSMYDALIDLFCACEREDILPMGLSDAHILIGADGASIRLSTIHRFLRLPAHSAPGRTPGTPWYRAPETHEPGAALDETCAVYAAGALAHTFAGDRVHHAQALWEGSPDMLRVAGAALQPRPRDRQQSMAAYQAQWRAAVAGARLPCEPIPR